MSNGDLSEALAQGEILVLDGGIGGELQQRGFDLDCAAWSATAQLTAPDMLRQIHEDYIHAGAQIITTNTFSAAKHVLEAAGLGNEFQRVNKLAVKLAQQAREAAASEQTWVAGSVSTIQPMDKTKTKPNDKTLADNYSRQAELLTEAGVDVLIAEMMLDSGEIGLLVEACSDFERPLWIGLSASLSSDEEATVTAFRPTDKCVSLPDEPFDQLINAIDSSKVDAVGVMHTKTNVIKPALAELSKNWAGPKLAYAEIRRAGDSDWDFEPGASAFDYATEAQSWLSDFGVQVIGGCCGTRPKHIKALSDAVKTFS